MLYADLIVDHGTELITDICITTGFSAGTDSAALLGGWRSTASASASRG